MLGATCCFCKSSIFGQLHVKGLSMSSLYVWILIVSLYCISGTGSNAQTPDYFHNDQCKTRSCYPATGNLLIGRERQLKATSTCGLNYPEPYCIVSHLEDRKKCFRCDSRKKWMRHVNEKSHRIENVISDNLEMRMKKWWQSENGVENVSVQLNLEAEFHFTHLIMTFKSFRPAAMLIERSSDYGKTWKVYRYFAYDCQESFPAVPEASVVQRHGEVICDPRYSKVEPSSGGEVVYRVLSPQINTSDPFAPEIQDLLRVTNLRVNFTKLHTLGDNLLDNRPEISEKYYYAVYDMIVRGSCSCYGHAEHCIPTERDGVTFEASRRSDMVHGRCQCTHNTKGMNCEECEDFFNDLPWRPAVDREINACKRCECNNHATRCHFDKSVYEASGYVSGGVCDDCQHDTMGKNCEQCKPYFYREPGRSIDDPYGCRACECDLRGSLNQGICDSETDAQHNLVAGKCHCKPNVDGERCDHCKNGFWQLDQNNPDGCKPCTCFLLGTYGNEGCNKETGECTCKRLVTGDNCDRCLPEHYGLSDDVEGCRRCDCDLGGAVDNDCDVTTGQCQCRQHFTGRRCETPESGFYCAHLDHFTYEAEDARLVAGATLENREPPTYDRSRQTWSGTGYVKLREQGELEFHVSDLVAAGLYHIVVRFESHHPDPWDNVRVNIVRPDQPRSDGPCGDALPKDDFLTAVLQPGVRYHEILQTVCLETGVEYKISLLLGMYRTSYEDRSAFLLIDSILLVPATSTLSVLTERRRLEFEHYRCREAVLDLAARERLSHEPCRSFVCPLAAALLDSGVECRCDPTGSTSGICEPSGGQCQCKPNVDGRRCDRCAPGNYGLGPQGCSACECNSVGALDNFCEQRTGQCKCRDGVYGRQCDQCQPGYWGFPDCRPCECNGHAEICDQQSGACIDCRDLTTSHHCDRCQDGYYGDPRIGLNIMCRPCPCPGGPGSGYQHADTCYLDPPSQNVVCNCKQGYVGERCDTCGLNYWGNPQEAGGSCERCDCNGNIDFAVPDSCDALTGRCTKCIHFSDGFQCEHCIAGYFGDAKIQQCQKCVCNVLGTDANADACDRVSGQCPCLPNVRGLRCDACAPLHWKLASAAGCEPCGCDPVGVATDAAGQPQQQCNEFDGQCACKLGRGGRTCAECEDYYWGDPRVECRRCECNPQGSTTLQCHRENGTCQCQPGSGGPHCDQCARGYTGTWPDCYPCGECFQNWDKILANLKADTQKLVDQASNLESTGVASVYDKEFNEMDTKLNEVKGHLQSANITRAEVDKLMEKMDDIEKTLQDARARLLTADQRATETGAQVDAADAVLRSLRADAQRLSDDATDFARNATLLRQADVQGAFNVTRESAHESRDAKQRADAARRRAEHDASLRRSTAEKLTLHEQDFTKQFQENQAALDDVGVRVKELTSKIPSLNLDICGATGDPCDDLCGGAKCGKCGGPSCADGAVTKAEQAYQYSKEANEKLEQKQRAANELAHKLRASSVDHDKVLQESRSALEAATRLAQQGNATRHDLQTDSARAAAMLNGKGATLQEIRSMANEVLNMSIAGDPTEIVILGRDITDKLTKLTNIDVILAETGPNLTKAQHLKDKANQINVQAETMLNKTQAVVESLENANESQQLAKAAADKANTDIQSARNHLSAIATGTTNAEQSVNESSVSFSALKNDSSQVEVDYLQIDKDVQRAEQLINAAKTESDQIEQQRGDLESKLQQAQTAFDDKVAGAGSADQATASSAAEADELRRKASELSGALHKVLSMEQEIKLQNLNDAKLRDLEPMLASLIEEVDQYSAIINDRYNFFENCS